MAGDVRVFCTLLWKQNGGPVNEKGQPVDPNRVRLRVISSEEIEDDLDQESGHKYARGKCEADFDCTQCELMYKQLQFYPPEEVHWLCPSCVSYVLRTAKKTGVSLVVPGHHGEGVCTFQRCQRPSRQEMADGLPGIPSGQIIALPAGYSRLLQLVVGPVNHIH